MPITFDASSHIFKLDTPSSSYAFMLFSENYLVHLYYGPKVPDIAPLAALMDRGSYDSFSPRNPALITDRSFSLDFTPQEFPGPGCGDYRIPAVEVRSPAGDTVTDFRYVSHKIYPGKPALEGLPATFAQEGEAETLEVEALDPVTGVKAHLLYTVFAQHDAIARSVRLENTGVRPVDLERVMSLCLDLPTMDYDLIHVYGRWAKENTTTRTPLRHGCQSFASRRGMTSHSYNPFAALLRQGAGEEQGEAIGVGLIYSGNFSFEVEVDHLGCPRLAAGIEPSTFCWRLEPGESFQSPEAVMVFSQQGLGGMSRTFHRLYNQHLIHGEWAHKKRPLLINSWEAAYFDFDAAKLVEFAQEAGKLGIEMLVMDDGWFGNRFDDNRALGDWVVNEQKLNGGLKYLVDEVNKLGMKFGIWFEPEMISPDSDLYRAHPDWAIAISGREPGLARNQYVLDLSRKEVRDHVYESVAKVLRGANIEYVKWDMNRPLSDIGSATLPADQMGEFYHRYVLGVYEMQERLTGEFPHLLLENCSGGGARFDPGMLFYSPQIWCSDDTDAVERLKIQEGTALIYPLSTMGAHVSDCPNHVLHRTVPFETRGYVALAGTFGYELDVTRIPEEDRRQIPEQTAMYHKYNDLVREGDYYRIASYAENHYFDCWGVVSKDKAEALYTFIQVLNRPNYHSRRIRLKGLDPEKTYRIEGEESTYLGELLMKAGINIPNPEGDFRGRLIHLTEC